MTSPQIGNRRGFASGELAALVPLGLIKGYTALEKFGRNDDIDVASGFEDIWTAGGEHVAPTTGRIHSIVSDSTADDLGGTGAEKLDVFGLSDAGVLQEETDIELNGTAPVLTTKSFSFIHRMQVSQSGSGNKNAGKITATAQTDSTVSAEIAVGKSKTLMAIFKVPVATTLLITQYHGTMFKDVGTETIGLIELVFINGSEAVEDTLGLQKSGSSLTPRVYTPYKAVPALTIVKLRASVTANDVGIGGAFDGYLVAD